LFYSVVIVGAVVTQCELNKLKQDSLPDLFGILILITICLAIDIVLLVSIQIYCLAEIFQEICFFLDFHCFTRI